MRWAVYVVTGIIGLVALFFAYIIFGVPIHDYRLWKLDRAYRSAASLHPTNSYVVARKSYLGGPDTHGSSRCNYVVGELRATPLSRNEITAAYKSASTTSIAGKDRIPLEVLFFEEGTPWPPELPWWTWEGELYSLTEGATGTPYFVFAAVRNVPFWGDLRCDD